VSSLAEDKIRAAMGLTHTVIGAKIMNEYSFLSSEFKNKIKNIAKAQITNTVRSVRSVPPLPTVARAKYPPKAPTTVPKIAALLSYFGTFEY
jgi:hypothetical protein